MLNFKDQLFNIHMNGRIEEIVKLRIQVENKLGTITQSIIEEVDIDEGGKLNRLANDIGDKLNLFSDMLNDLKKP